MRRRGKRGRGPKDSLVAFQTKALAGGLHLLHGLSGFRDSRLPRLELRFRKGEPVQGPLDHVGKLPGEATPQPRPQYGSFHVVPAAVTPCDLLAVNEQSADVVAVGVAGSARSPLIDKGK